MKISDLKTFLDIVDAGGLTAAANRRGVTQPGLSRTLRDLETRLQAQLLRRTGRGIELTPAGEEFLKFSVETLDRLAETQKQIALQSKALPRQLSLSIPLRLSRLLIPGLYRAFAERLPQTTVHIFEEPSDRARNMLMTGQLDVALTYRNAFTPDRDFVPLCAENLYAVGHIQDLGDDRRPICANDLCKLPLLLPGRGRYQDLIQTAIRAAGHSLPAARELETAEGLLAFAAEGEGVAILPMSNVYQEVARGDVTARLISDPTIGRAVGLQFSADMPKHATGPVLSIVRKAMQEAAPDADWRRLKSRDKKVKKEL